MSKFFKTTGAASCMLLVALLAGCASPANRAAMVPHDMALAKHHPYSVQVETRGGSETGALDSSNISDADLKAALEEAITQSKVFKSVVQGRDGDYELNVQVVNVSKPIFGATFTVELETAWSLVKTSDHRVAMRKSVKSSGTATMGDALVAVTRLRLAVENAARNNIDQGLRAVAELQL